MAIPPEYKHPQLTPNCVEKELLRSAFDVSEDDGFGKVKPYLPKEILWRQKEQFSDGVGYSWIDKLKEHAERMVDDDAFAERAERFPYNTPTTKEAFFFRKIFEEFYCPESVCPTQESKLPILKTVVKWIPRKGMTKKTVYQIYKRFAVFLWLPHHQPVLSTMLMFRLGMRRRSQWPCTKGARGQL
jgi:asparagine synthetase B (glutamine-hydrolysing)